MCSHLPRESLYNVYFKALVVFSFETESCSRGWPEMYYLVEVNFESQSSSYKVPSVWPVGMHHHSRLCLKHFNVYTELTEKLSGGNGRLGYNS